MKEIESYKKAHIPHLRATVHFMDLSKLKGVEVKGSAYTTIFEQDENMNLTVGIFYQNIEESVKRIACMPMIFHEIVHALQYICEQRSIDMELEKEHIGYMASFLTEHLLDLNP